MPLQPSGFPPPAPEKKGKGLIFGIAAAALLSGPTIAGAHDLPVDYLIEKKQFERDVFADDPLTCVARGGGRALEMMDEKGVDVFSTE